MHYSHAQDLCTTGYARKRWSRCQISPLPDTITTVEDVCRATTRILRHVNIGYQGLRAHGTKTNEQITVEPPTSSRRRRKSELDPITVQ